MPIINTGQHYHINGAPSDGVDAVQILTIGGTPDGGTFILGFGAYETAAISWSATNNTLIANIDTALEALPNIGTGGVTVADVDLSSGIGSVSITFGGNLKKLNVPLITVEDDSLTGTDPTIEVEEGTPGVTASARFAAVGETLQNTANGDQYVNVGAALAPRWLLIEG